MKNDEPDQSDRPDRNDKIDPGGRPVLIYDGDCRFCTFWVKRWQAATGNAVEYLPSQDPTVPGRFPDIPREQYDKSVVWIDVRGQVAVGARAALEALAANPRWAWLKKAYDRWPWWARLSEWGYSQVAAHRSVFSSLTRLACGSQLEVPSYRLTAQVFLRVLGLIYLAAFLSLWVQVEGLVGSQGILPADGFMGQVEQQVSAQGIGGGRYVMLPTLGWWSASDASLHAQCAAGVLLALCVMLGVAPALSLLLLWGLYLSLSVLCRVFLGFQWDILLLEVGFLSIFLAPRPSWCRPSLRWPAVEPSRLALWMLRLLLLKLMLQSGLVKLLSGDEWWRNGLAMTVHYETQPLPTWIGYYAHQLPVWFQKISCVIMFAIELAVPLLIVAPRRWRVWAAAFLAGFQVLILLTGNYTYFNWLTIALCLLLLDDFVVGSWKHKARLWLGRVLHKPRSTVSPPRPGAASWPRWVLIPLFVAVATTYVSQIVWTWGKRPWVLEPVARWHQWVAPWRTLNSYGLFAVMTRTRPEIVVEGSLDGVTWSAYEFRYKPGELERCPRFVAPHQPRLDWQMWFAALGQYQNNPWFVAFCSRLLEGSPEVLGLLAENPFPNDPPRYIRARLYEYRFTTLAEREKTGAWWKREYKRMYMPVMERRRMDVSGPGVRGRR